MQKIFSEIIKTKTIQHSAITLGGTLINGLLGVIFFALLARNLGPENFGLLSVAISVLTLLADISDLGINTGIINFVGRYVKNDPFKAYRFMKLGLKIKFLVWLGISLSGFILSPFIARHIFLKPELISPLRLVTIGVGGAMLFSFVTNSLQALQRFWQWSILNVLMNCVRLLIVLVLIFGMSLTLESALFTYLGVLFLGFILGLFLLPRDFLKVSSEKSLLKDLFHYNKWVALSILLAAIASRLDTFVSTRLLSVSAIGIYSVANQLSSVVPQLVFAIASAVAPKVASFTNDKEVVSYLKKLQLLVLGLALIGLLGIPIAIYAIPLFYGIKYQQSIAPFVILFISQLFFLNSIPSSQAIFYYFSKPKIFAYLSLVQFLLAGIASWILVNQMGIIGAALSVLVTDIVIFATSGFWVIRQFKNRASNLR